jgi:hypothetical protein
MIVITVRKEAVGNDAIGDGDRTVLFCGVSNKRTEAKWAASFDDGGLTSHGSGQSAGWEALLPQAQGTTNRS